MDSKILKEIHETALGMYKCGTMSKQVYLTFKDIYEAAKSETTENKVSKKSE